MNRKYLTTSVLGLLAVLMLPGLLLAQGIRPTQTLFLRGYGGISFYLGDNEQSPFNFNMDAYKVDGKFPYAVGANVGYQFSPSFGVMAGYEYAEFPVITQFPYLGNNTEVIEEHQTTRRFVQLIGQYTVGGATSRVAPYLLFGGMWIRGDVLLHRDLVEQEQGNPDVFGNVEDEKDDFGAVAGLGLDFVISDRASLFTEWLSNITFDDEAADGNDLDGFGGSDFLNSINVGLKFNFKSAFTPVEVLGLNCPTTLLTTDTGTFTATVNDDATQPVDYRWEFGDGAVGAGTTATHRFATPGTYTVTFTAMNGRDPATATCVVTVNAPPVAAQIVSITANPMSPTVCTPIEPVRFSANTRGDAPLTYRWDFGDGETSTEANPSHVYDEPGTYTVSLTVSNAVGTDTRTMTITVLPCEAEYCTEITEMNAVFFDQNSSTLTEQARASLQENLQILRDCPSICVQVVGYAAPGERNPQQLSEDRARAVAQFYMDAGISADRIVTIGRGRVEGQTSKKEGIGQFRRVDTIPVPCEDLDDDM